jgi:hypothetical protein
MTKERGDLCAEARAHLLEGLTACQREPGSNRPTSDLSVRLKVNPSSKIKMHIYYKVATDVP